MALYKKKAMSSCETAHGPVSRRSHNLNLNHHHQPSRSTCVSFRAYCLYSTGGRRCQAIFRPGCARLLTPAGSRAGAWLEYMAQALRNQVSGDGVLALGLPEAVKAIYHRAMDKARCP